MLACADPVLRKPLFGFFMKNWTPVSPLRSCMSAMMWICGKTAEELVKESLTG